MSSQEFIGEKTGKFVTRHEWGGGYG